MSGSDVNASEKYVKGLDLIFKSKGIIWSWKINLEERHQKKESELFKETVKYLDNKLVQKEYTFDHRQYFSVSGRPENVDVTGNSWNLT